MNENKNQTPTYAEAKEQINTVDDAVEFVENHAPKNVEIEGDDENKKVKSFLYFSKKEHNHLYFVFVGYENGTADDHTVVDGEWKIQD